MVRKKEKRRQPIKGGTWEDGTPPPHNGRYLQAPGRCSLTNVKRNSRGPAIPRPRSEVRSETWHCIYSSAQTGRRGFRARCRAVQTCISCPRLCTSRSSRNCMPHWNCWAMFAPAPVRSSPVAVNNVLSLSSGVGVWRPCSSPRARSGRPLAAARARSDRPLGSS